MDYGGDAAGDTVFDELDQMSVFFAGELFDYLS